MAGILRVINTIEMATTIGAALNGRQGSVTNPAAQPYTLPVTGSVHQRVGTLAFGAAATIYDSTVDLPATFVYLWFKMDIVGQIQLLTGATHVVLPVAANQPFTLGAPAAETPATCGLLGVADFTNITAAADLAVIDEITIVNTAGSGTANYQLFLVL